MSTSAPILLAFLVATAFEAAAQQDPPTPPASETPAPAPKPPRMTRYWMTAGDLDGDGRDESIVYNTDSKTIWVYDYSGPSPLQTMAHMPADVPTVMTTADLDGDGKAELIVGEGLVAYNKPDEPQVDVTIKIYSPRSKGEWLETEVYRKASARPQVTSLRVLDLDGDGKLEILFAYFASKYECELRIARQVPDGWSVSELPSARMGAHVDAGMALHSDRAMVVVGRPYGDPAGDEKVSEGDAFVLDGERRIELPVTRGVSAVAVGDLDGKSGDEIVLADGWHSNYGKIARCRLAVLSRSAEGWQYELVEDLPDHIRFETIELVDLTGDGRPEIVARAGAQRSLGGTVRVYERTGDGWRGLTAAVQVQTFASGDFDGDGRRELVFAGAPPLPFTVGAGAAWEPELGAAVETRVVDAAKLVGATAPPLRAAEWIGSEPLTLAGLRGKVVLIDFWATWCQPCIAMYPQMREWVKQYGPQGLVIVGITNHSSQTSAEVVQWVEEQELPWPVLIDPQDDVHRDYGASAIPHTFLIDRQGVLRFQHTGAGDLTQLETQLKRLLAEPTKAGK